MLNDAHRGAEIGDVGSDGWLVGCASYIVELYGIHQLIADIDSAREYREGGIVASVLDCITTRQFREFFKDVESDYTGSALQFRQRYMLAALEQKGAF